MLELSYHVDNTGDPETKLEAEHDEGREIKHGKLHFAQVWEWHLLVYLSLDIFNLFQHNLKQTYKTKHGQNLNSVGVSNCNDFSWIMLYLNVKHCFIGFLSRPSSSSSSSFSSSSSSSKIKRLFVCIKYEFVIILAKRW